MNAIAAVKQTGGQLVTADQAAAIRRAMKSSLYPGASDDSIEMVLAYCQATGLDPMTKPVHIVPMKVKVGENPDGSTKMGMRDVVMPGIGKYRIDASRTGQYAGCSEPEFGPTLVMDTTKEIWEDRPNGSGRQKRLVPFQMSYPEWCRVTVRKFLGGQVVEFSAKEYWIENYASKSDGTPNSMWEKRAFGQLAKCTEAQALRKAFPEAVGSQPTAEEMEGKDVIDGDATVVEKQAPAAALPPALPMYPQADFDKNLTSWREFIASGRTSADTLIAKLQTKAQFTDAQLAAIRAPAAQAVQAEPAPAKSNPNFPLDDDQQPEDQA